MSNISSHMDPQSRQSEDEWAIELKCCGLCSCNSEWVHMGSTPNGLPRVVKGGIKE